jgi:hypothetical protein
MSWIFGRRWANHPARRSRWPGTRRTELELSRAIAALIEAIAFALGAGHDHAREGALRLAQARQQRGARQAELRRWPQRLALGAQKQ